MREPHRRWLALATNLGPNDKGGKYLYEIILIVWDQYLASATIEKLAPKGTDRVGSSAAGYKGRYPKSIGIWRIPYSKETRELRAYFRITILATL
jgi:hypothetical protein